MARAPGMGAYYSPGTVDQWPLNVVGTLLFGGMWNAPVPDLDRTDHLIVLGANPSASQGSMLSAPDVTGRLAAIRHRGGKVVVFDPRRTETARGPRVGADPAGHRRAGAVRHPAHPRRRRSMLRRPPHLRGRCVGLDEVIALAEPFTPEAVAGPSGIAAAEIRRLAARPRRARDSGALQPDRHLHTGIRHARHLAGVRPQRGTGSRRPARWVGLPQAGGLVADVHEAARPDR